MSCVLSIIGVDFDPDAFLLASKLNVEKVGHKGQPRYKTRPDSMFPHSLVSVCTSKAGFDEFDQQVDETIEYLKSNYEQLKVIAQTENIQYAHIDFGVNYMGKFMQTHHFPLELVKLCAELGLCIEVSVYTSSD